MQKKVAFESSAGFTLAGVLHLPDAGPTRANALFAHCFTCTKDVKAEYNIAEALCSEGIAVLRFDFTGLGQSEGEFADTRFSGNVQDLLDAAEFMGSERRAPEILVGHSLGGTAILAAAQRIDSAKAVATIGSPAEARHVLGLLQDEMETIEEKGEAEVKLAGRTFRIRKDFVDDVRSQSVRDTIKDLRRALLVMHSPVDEVVPVEEAARIYESAMHPKSFISLDTADHLLTKERDSRYAGHVLAAWASRFIHDPDEDIEPAIYHTGHVVASGKPEDIFRVSINADGHPMKGDEPEQYGGTDAGPSPYDLLSAALASCTVMTLNMYSRRKRLPLESVRVDVQHGKVHAKDCLDCEGTSGQIDRFVRTIYLQGELDDAQRQRILEIADRCPVHRTLHGEIRIDSSLQD
ncbi:MAG: bifunctional alpha/beta hydrolase/OsmC family protein [Lysobacterales bacterium]|jgi:putative redox protein